MSQPPGTDTPTHPPTHLSLGVALRQAWADGVLLQHLNLLLLQLGKEALASLIHVLGTAQQALVVLALQETRVDVILH